MKRHLMQIGVLLMALGAGTLAGAKETGISEMKVEKLRCEYLVDPIAIDTPAPRLSWILTSPHRAEKQAAWQVLVASDAQQLNNDKGDLWDSGKFAGPDTNQIVYKGNPLQSAQRCWWKVRAWDKDGAPTAWSQPARWEMGLLNPEDWKAKWIGTDDKIVPVVGLEGASWIRSADSTDATSGPIFFRKEISGLPNSKALRALARFASDKPLTIYWNGHEIGRTSGDWQKLEVFNPGEHLKPQGNVVAARMDNVDTSASLIAPHRRNVGFRRPLPHPFR